MSPASEPTHFERVWYCAYGSNMSAERLAYYLVGGQPDGADRTYVGCREPEIPADQRTIRIPHQLYFAKHSPNWNGGVAFVAPGRSDESGAWCVARLVTSRQLADLCSQECGRNGADLELDDAVQELFIDLSTADLGVGDLRNLRSNGWYRSALAVAPIDGVPAVTLTSSVREQPTRPTVPYIDWIRKGLREAGLREAEVDAYLAAAQRSRDD